MNCKLDTSKRQNYLFYQQIFVKVNWSILNVSSALSYQAEKGLGFAFL